MKKNLKKLQLENDPKKTQKNDPPPPVNLDSMGTGKHNSFWSRLKGKTKRKQAETSKQGSKQASKQGSKSGKLSEVKQSK